jgi:hypothetical protein
MEWLRDHTYTRGVEQPPLARIAVALGPYLLGVHSYGLPDAFLEGNAILYSEGRYWPVLTAARVGTLVFFVAACVFVYLWARRWFGLPTAMLALLIFTCLPPILGHSGVATVDVAQAATLLAALYALLRWLEASDLRSALLAGLAVGLAVLAKFSNLTFFAACVLVAAVFRPRPWPKPFVALLSHCAAAVMVAILTIWVGYLFHFEPLIQGLRVLSDHAAEGHPSYLLGEYRKTGWWYFFPVVLAVKTPLAFLLLVVFLPVRDIWSSWQRRPTLLFPLAILVSCLPSRINLGVRHILSFYPLFSILIAFAVIQAVSVRRKLAAALLALGVVESAAAHPDYLASFNLLAGSHPERIVCESDLDWGQDLYRLSNRLRELRVPSFSFAYFGTAYDPAFGFPPVRPLSPTVPTNGYVAISLHHLVIDHAKTGSFDWLTKYQPIERVGKSIQLYRIP